MQGSYKTKKEEEENEWKKRHKSQKRERKKRVGVFGQRGSANSLLRQSEKPLPGLLLVWEWGGGKNTGGTRAKEIVRTEKSHKIRQLIGSQRDAWAFRWEVRSNVGKQWWLKK